MGQEKKLFYTIGEDLSQQESIFEDTSPKKNPLHPLFKDILESYATGINTLLTKKSNKNETRNI